MHEKTLEYSFEAILEPPAPLRGQESTLGDFNSYITGDSRERAVLYIHDIKGWTSINARRLADLYAREVGATVYIPDLYGGEVPPQKHDELLKFDFLAFKSRNTKHIRRPELYACAQKLRQQYAKVGVVGYCFGGWAGLDLGSKHNSGAHEGDHQGPLVDCVSIAHPAWVEESELRNVGVPTQIIAPEHDNPFNPELKKLANDVIPKAGVAYTYVDFPGVEHRFASQPDLYSVPEKDHELWKASFEKAQIHTVVWLRMWL